MPLNRSEKIELIKLMAKSLDVKPHEICDDDNISAYDMTRAYGYIVDLTDEEALDELKELSQQIEGSQFHDQLMAKKPEEHRILDL